MKCMESHPPQLEYKTSCLMEFNILISLFFSFSSSFFGNNIRNDAIPDFGIMK